MEMNGSLVRLHSAGPVVSMMPMAGPSQGAQEL
jgi:hypothetical protein